MFIFLLILILSISIGNNKTRLKKRAQTSKYIFTPFLKALKQKKRIIDRLNSNLIK